MRKIFPGKNRDAKNTISLTRLTLESLEERIALDATIAIRAAGFSGEETMELQIDGETVQTWTNIGGDYENGIFETFEHTHPTDLTADQIRIAFTNDDEAPGVDRNLRVDGITLDGVIYESESPNVLSTGTYRESDGCAPGFKSSEFLHCDGYFQYASLTPPDGSQVTILAAGETGLERMELQIDGVTVQGWNNVGGDYFGGVFEAFTYTHTTNLTADQIRVAFTNDGLTPSGADKNLRVDNISIDSVVFETEDSTVLSTGTFTEPDGCAPGFKSSEFLHCQGYFQYASIPGTDPGSIEVESEFLEVAEGAQEVILTFVRTGGSSGSGSVTYQTANGAAEEGLDYTGISSGVVPFSDGQISATVSIPILEDTVDEIDENFTVTLVESQGVLLGTSLITSVTILDNDVPTINFASSALDVDESAGNATLTVLRSGGSIGAATVNYQTSDGTATDGADYSATTSGIINFADGQTSATIEIPILEDILDEIDEDFTVTLTGPQGADLGSAVEATVTIQDNDVPTVSFAETQVNVNESAGQVSLTILRTGSVGTATVTYETTAGTAVDGEDYLGTISGTATFLDGETATTLNIPIVNDAEDEPNEIFSVSLLSAQGADLGAELTATVTIIDSTVPAISFAADSAVVDEDAGQVTLSLLRIGGTLGEATVTYQTADITAASGSDYTGTSNGIVTFLDGEESASIIVPILEDGEDEIDETFVISLVGVQGAGLGSITSNTVTIADNDVPVVDFLETQVDIDEGAGQVVLTLVRSGGSVGEATITYQTIDGSATAANDYTEVSSGLATFADGETTQTIEIPILEDDLDEGFENFTVSLLAADNANLGIADTATVTILDNDVPIIGFQLTQTTIDEGGGQVDLTLLRIGGSNGPATVTYQTTQGTAQDGLDYTGTTNGTVDFIGGQTSATISIPILEDSEDEIDETFTVTLLSSQGADLGTEISTTVTIIDNDIPTIDVTPTQISVDEDAGQVTLTLQRTGGSIGPATVDYQTTNGTATEGTDYTGITNGVATFNDGETSTTIAIPILEDTADEPDETFTLSLTGVQGAALGSDLTSTITILDNDLPAVNSEVIIRAAGATGEEVMELQIDGTTVQTWTNIGGDYFGGVFEVFTYTHTSLLTPSQFRVAFTNDGDTTSGEDKNLRVDGITLDGVIYESESPDVLTTGTYTVPDGCEPGFKSSEFLHCDGYFQYADPIPTGPGLIGMDETQITVNEEDGEVIVTLIRYDGSEGTAIAEYQTINGGAVDGEDFVGTTAGTVNFDDGQTLATFAIPIINDIDIEGLETFGVSLFGSGGADLGEPRTTTITIVDDDNPDLAPKAHYEFDETGPVAIDSAGSNDGVLQNLSDNDRIPGAFGNALEFNGSNSYVEVPDSSSLDITTEITLAAWVRVDVFGTWDGFITKGITNSPYTLQQGSGGVVRFYANQGGNGTGQGFWDSNTSLVEGKWHHIAVTYDGSELIFYIDGQQDRTVQTSLVFATNNQALVLGADFPGGDEYLDGAMDDVRIYNRALSLTEVNALLEGANPPITGTFTSEVLATGFFKPVAVDWLPDGRMLVAEQQGIVRLVNQDGSVASTPFIDLTDRVGFRHDRGMLGLAVHPDFTNNPYVYFSYTYDPPEVNGNSGSGGPDGNGARVARIVRVTADASNNFSTADPATEFILIGNNSTYENIGEPNQPPDLDDPYSCEDLNGDFIPDCIPADEVSHTIGDLEFGPDGSLYASSGDGGSFGRVDPINLRAQEIDSLAGKILRFDPITGEGLPDNPFYDGDPDSNRSKVYALGVRNPFRLAVNQQNNEVYIGDVGWGIWEEINTGAGANFGWPLFEGGNGQSLPTFGYDTLPEAQPYYAANPDVTPPLWSRTHSAGARAIVMGDFNFGTQYPAQYQGSLFFTDIGDQVLRIASFNPDGSLNQVDVASDSLGFYVEIAAGPDGYLYFADIAFGTIGRLIFEADGVAGGSNPDGSGGGGGSASGLVPPTPTEELTEYGFYSTGNLWINYSGWEEKWFKDAEGNGYFITPSGNIYLFGGPELSDNTLIARVDPSVYTDLSLLFSPTTIAPQLSAALFQEEYGFYSTDNLWKNWGGWEEKWFKDATGKGYFITPTGRIFRANGSQNLNSSLLVAKVDPIVYADLSLLFHADLVAANLSPADLQETFGFYSSGNLWEDWGGWSEKWFKDSAGKGLFITPSGRIYRAGGSKNLSTSTFVAQTDPEVYQDLSLLFDPNSVAPQMTTESLQETYGFKSTGNLWENWGGWQEKWFVDSNGKGHFITPSGRIYRAGGSQNLSTSTLVAFTDSAVFLDLSLLFDPNSVGVQFTPNQLQAAFGFKSTGNLWENWGGWEEKWFIDVSGKGYFITPSGRIYRAGGSQDLSSSKLIATLSPDVFHDLTLLFGAQPVAPETTADDLQYLFGFYSNGNLELNSQGWQEKWFFDYRGDKFFITPEGNVYRSTGSPVLLKNTLIAILDSTIYDDLDPLFAPD